MLSIYLCDDENKQADYYYKIIKNFILFKEWDVQIHPPFCLPCELLKQLQQSNQMPGLYFLDVDLKDSMDGFSLAKKIRSLDPRGFIVFLTAHGESVGLTFHFRVEAMDYIVKGDAATVKSRIEGCIVEAYQRYLSQAEVDDKLLCFKSGSKDLYFRRKEIISVSTSNTPHQLAIETSHCLFTVYGNLKSFEDLLGSGFVRIKKSCLINKSKIQEVDFKESSVRMENGALFQVSTRKLRTLRLMLDESDLN